MMIKKLAFLSTIAACALPLLSYADITITNSTKTSATAKFTGIINSPCSSAAGSRGVAKPFSSITVGQNILNVYCKAGCKAPVYMSESCQGNAVAIATIDSSGKVSSIENIPNPGGYYGSGSGNNVYLNGGPAKKWYELFF